MVFWSILQFFFGYFWPDFESSFRRVSATPPPVPGVQPLGVPGRGLHGRGQDSLPPRMRQVQTVRQGGASAGIIIIIDYWLLLLFLLLLLLLIFNLILEFKKYYPIEHIFVPACSSARKTHFFKF